MRLVFFIYLNCSFQKLAAALTMPDIPVEQLAAHANSYASANGIQVESRQKEDPTKSYYECAPMSLLPNAYPKEAFQQAQSVATAFNELVDRVSRDTEFLQETLGGGVSDTDPYTAKVLKLYKQVYGVENSIAHSADRLGILRSDYMLHAQKVGEPYQLKQVELNTIAASFAGLAVNVASLHRYLTSRFKTDVDEFLKDNQNIVTSSLDSAPGVPENPALSRIPTAMKVAYDRYCEKFSGGDSSNTIVLFVVQEGETNTVDQRMLEFRLWADHDIPVVRLSLTRASQEITVGDNGELKLGEKEIAVVYYRAGYAPTDYPDGDDGIEWKARLTLENSRAAKCPSLGYHLAGCKKVQQQLARPGVLERFFSKPEEKEMVEAMRAAFAGLYSLGEDVVPEDLAAVQDALDGKEGNYVLKPQREGGGYNFYGEQLKQKLAKNTSRGSEEGSLMLGEKLAEYTLMQRLFPPQQRAVLLRGGRVEGSGDSVSELGCYGTGKFKWHPSFKDLLFMNFVVLKTKYFFLYFL
jgi:glutathione synthase